MKNAEMARPSIRERLFGRRSNSGSPGAKQIIEAGFKKTAADHLQIQAY